MYLHNRRLLTKKRAIQIGGLGIKAAAQECVIAEEMQVEAKSDPKGASRLMTCLEDHVTGVPEDDDKLPLFTVWEFCGNLNLEDWLKDRTRNDKLTAADVASIFIQVMEGLSYMTMESHKKLYVHHDLKSENIVIKDTVVQGKMVPLVKIIDFGSVTRPPLDRDSRTGFIVTTDVFAAYEHWDTGGGYKKPWSSFDTFSAATILIEMLSTQTWTEMIFHQCMHVDGRRQKWCEQNYAKILRQHALPDETLDMVETVKQGATEASLSDDDLEGVWNDGGANYFTIPEFEPQVHCTFSQVVDFHLLVADLYYNSATQRYEGQVLCKDPSGCYVHAAKTEGTRNFIMQLIWGSNAHTG